MKTGTKSLLFGVHQFVWHSITVLLAWHKLYGWPNWKEFVCIIIHDWGYWFCENMDDGEGKTHPFWGALKAGGWFGGRYYSLCLRHSRHLAKHLNQQPSKLCWADKLSIKYEPWWLYLPRAWLSGELQEYRKAANRAGFLSIDKTHREWFEWVKKVMVESGLKEQGNMYLY